MLQIPRTNKYDNILDNELYELENNKQILN